MARTLSRYRERESTCNEGTNSSSYTLQMSILVAGAGWAILDAPVLLLPLQAALCEGIVCGSDMGRHIGVVSACSQLYKKRRYIHATE